MSLLDGPSAGFAGSLPPARTDTPLRDRRGANGGWGHRRVAFSGTPGRSDRVTRPGGTVAPSFERPRAIAKSSCREERAIVTLADPLPSSPPHGWHAVRPHLSARPARGVLWLIAGLLLWLLVGPRIDLPIAALRVEDLIFAVLAALCLLHVRAVGRPGAVTLAVLGVVSAGLIASAVAGVRGTLDPLTAVLFALRPLEYWIVLPAALLLLRPAAGGWARRVVRILAVTTVLQTTFAVLQYYFQVPVGFSHAAYTRAAGLTVGPYELGAMSAMLVVFWVSRGRWVLASASVVALAASIARVSILGAVLALAVLASVWTARQIRRVRRSGWRPAFQQYRRRPLDAAAQLLAVATAGLVLAFTLGIVALPTPRAAAPAPAGTSAEPARSEDPVPSASPSETRSPEPAESAAPEPEDAGPALPEVPAVPEQTVTTRLADTSVLGSWSVAGELAAAIPPLRTAAEYTDVAYSHMNDHLNTATAAASGAEPSNLVRFFRWHLILDTIDDPSEFLFGLGPSFVGPSVDGSYLRFFADAGALGALSWLVLIVMWLRRSTLWMACVTISLLVGALFIDIVYAQRPMVLFWLLLALSMTARTRRKAVAGAQPARPALASDPQRAGDRAGRAAPAGVRA